MDSHETAHPLVILQRNRGFAWQQQGGLWAKGYLFDPHQRYYEGHSVLDYFAAADTPETFRASVCQANGFFAVVRQTGPWLLAAVDRLRSLPLFYSSGGPRLVVADQAETICDVLGDPVRDPLAVEALLRCGYTVGPDTAYRRVKQLEAGQILAWRKSDGRIQTEFYFRHLHADPVHKPAAALIDELDGLTARWTERLIASARGRTIVVPLSGGYDSRSIVCSLKRAGYARVLCYSYGRPGGLEPQVARQVAQRLGYPIHVVPYGRSTWQRLFASRQFIEYCQYVANGCAVPHFQDFPALEELADRQALPGDAILTPGFCGDLLGGSYVPIELALGRHDALLREGLQQYLLRQHFYLLDSPMDGRVRQALAEAVRASCASGQCVDALGLASAAEEWFTRHKVARFVVNSLRAYEWFGFQWRMPLWDHELIAWWYRVPWTRRAASSLYHRFLFERLFRPMGVAFRKGGTKRRLEVRLRRLLGDRLAGALIGLGLRLRPPNAKDDPAGFEQARSLLLERLPETPGCGGSAHFNGLVAAWWFGQPDRWGRAGACPCCGFEKGRQEVIPA